MIAAIRSEFIKLRHTAYWIIHTFVPLAGAILFLFYFMFYGSVDSSEKVRLTMELTAMAFPLLISVIVGMNIAQEERSCHFQNLLAVANRKTAFLSKLTTHFLSGMISLTMLFLLFGVGVNISSNESFPWKLLLLTLPGLAFSSFVLYVLHLFLNLKFGLGISLFWGVFECLQCILYSNIELHGLWRCIPFSWSVNWINEIFSGQLSGQGTEWTTNGILTGCILSAVLCWFTHWEGRKNYE